MTSLRIRIYYEDTDAGGVVYYANYLKFAERARTEMLRELGVEQRALLEAHGIAFVVRKAEMDLKAPAYLDDELIIHTHIEEIRPASLRMMQRISRHPTAMQGKADSVAHICVKIACVALDENNAFKPTPLPKDLLEKFAKIE